jgi:hypothetical protein
MVGSSDVMGLLLDSVVGLGLVLHVHGVLNVVYGGVLVVSALNVGHMGLLSVVRLRGLVGRLMVGLHCLVLHNGN